MKIIKPNITPGEWIVKLPMKIDTFTGKIGSIYGIESNEKSLGVVASKENAQAIACVPEMLDKLLEFAHFEGVVELLIKAGCVIEY